MPAAVEANPAAAMHQQLQTYLLLRTGGQIQIGFVGSGQMGNLRVLHYTDHLHVTLALHVEDLAEGILIRPEPPRGGLGDDRDGSAGPRFSRGEVAPSYNRNSQKREELRRDLVELHLIICRADQEARTSCRDDCR